MCIRDSLSLVGIGATLQEKDEYTTIRELITGSPAAKSGPVSYTHLDVYKRQASDCFLLVW